MNMALTILRRHFWKVTGNLLLASFGSSVVYSAISASRPLSAVQGSARGIAIAGWQFLMVGVFMCIVAVAGLFNTWKNGRA